MKHRIEKPNTAIYGLFDKETGDCLYVGATEVPRKRKTQHRRSVEGANLEFRVIRWVKSRFAPSVEEDTIMEYKSRGQARLNRAFAIRRRPLLVSFSLHRRMQIKARRLGLKLYEAGLIAAKLWLALSDKKAKNQ